MCLLTVQIPPKKRVLNRAHRADRMALTRKHEVDHNRSRDLSVLQEVDHELYWEQIMNCTGNRS